MAEDFTLVYHPFLAGNLLTIGSLTGKAVLILTLRAGSSQNMLTRASSLAVHSGFLGDLGDHHWTCKTFYLNP